MAEDNALAKQASAGLADDTREEDFIRACGALLNKVPEDSVAFFVPMPTAERCHVFMLQLSARPACNRDRHRVKQWSSNAETP